MVAQEPGGACIGPDGRRSAILRINLTEGRSLVMTSDYERIGSVLEYMAQNWGTAPPPQLEQLARECGLSPFHFQRLFERWVGLTPKRFLSAVTLHHAREALTAQHDLLTASLEAGLSGPGRLHDLFVTYEAMTPGAYKQSGTLTIRYGWHEGPFGQTLLMVTDRGLCGLAFLDDRGREACFMDLADRWPGAAFAEDVEGTAPLMGRIFNDPAQAMPDRNGTAPLRLLLKGTPFQIKVWEALMALRPGHLTSYGRLAETLSLKKGASRAIGSAVGANPISWLIPCHRVIRESGMLGGYRWGLPRKVAMLGMEQSGKGVGLRMQGLQAEFAN